VAENLDRSHSQVIAGLTVRTRKDDVRLELTATGDAELEMWATGRHIAPFEQVVGHPVKLVLAATGRAMPLVPVRREKAVPARPKADSRYMKFTR
jgi:hypothetical protein